MIFLTTSPLWLSALLLVGLPTLLSMVGPILIRRRVGLESLSNNNEVAGFKFAVVGVLYAVLLAFAVIVVWEKFSDSEEHVAQEAGAAAPIYRLGTGIGGAPAIALRSRLTDYLDIAISQDWPAMAHGEDSPATTRALDDVYKGMLQFAPTTVRDG